MITLCFGLPGTGKSTFVKKHKRFLQLDLGHNSFKSEEARSKFYKKLQRFTSELVSVGVVGDVFWDTYPEYFDIKTLDISKISQIYIAIPSSEEEAKELVERVGDRDGRSSEFYKLYSKQCLKWRTDWMAIANTWKSKFGKAKVLIIPRYDIL